MESLNEVITVGWVIALYITYTCLRIGEAVIDVLYKKYKEDRRKKQTSILLKEGQRLVIINKEGDVNVLYGPMLSVLDKESIYRVIPKGGGE